MPGHHKKTKTRENRKKIKSVFYCLQFFVLILICIAMPHFLRGRDLDVGEVQDIDTVGAATTVCAAASLFIRRCLGGWCGLVCSECGPCCDRGYGRVICSVTVYVDRVCCVLRVSLSERGGGWSVTLHVYLVL